MKDKLHKYEEWIMINYSTPESAKCKCEIATKQLSNEFPELKIIRGQILVEEPFDLPPTKTTHWWCITTEGNIVDPTGHQYPTKIISYHPLDENKGEPTGKCMNCGNISYNGSDFCKEECRKEFVKSMDGC